MRILKIGSRESHLAMAQSREVEELLLKLNVHSEIISQKSFGDKCLSAPLYAMGIEGIFTKELDSALLAGEIDMAVHSMKDMPTQLAEGLCIGAVLKRADNADVLVSLKNPDFLYTETSEQVIIATGSVRRQAQWRNRYPHHNIVGLRGNVPTRIRKIKENSWDGAIFAIAGLQRLGLHLPYVTRLDWMLPAPAQGAIAVVIREEDRKMQLLCEKINDRETEICTGIERGFLAALKGGCSTPVGAKAELKNGIISFYGNLLSTDGKVCFNCHRRLPLREADTIATSAGDEILNKGGYAILEMIQNAGKN